MDIRTRRRLRPAPFCVLEITMKIIRERDFFIVSLTNVEKVVKQIQSDLEDKTILEVACGCGEFSIAAAKPARKVYCIDLDSQRLLPSYTQPSF